MVIHKIYAKTIFKTIKNKFVRFLVNLLIVMISIAIAAALGVLPFSFKESYLENFNNNTPDIILKSKNQLGFNNDDIDKIKNVSNLDKYYSFFNVDILNNDKYERLYFIDFNDDNLGNPELVEGRLPKNYNEILLNKNADNTYDYNIGDKIIFNDYKFDYPSNNKEFEIVGIVNNSLYSSTHPVRAYTEDEEYINSIFYIDIDTVPSLIKGYLPITDIYLSMKEKREYMTDEYDNELDIFISSIKNNISGDYEILTLNENAGYAYFNNYNTKIYRIGIIFPVLFIIVGGLIVYLIITRLIADERAMIACYYSIGGSKRSIRFKYTIYSFLSTLIGALGGYFIGLSILPKIFYGSYEAIYTMHGMINVYYSPIGIVMAIFMVLVSLIVTLISINISLNETPASIMLPPSPKPGKKILLEKIPFIWNKLSFSFKSCIRNIFRNQKNLILTSLSVIGSVTLVIIGLGLFDSANALKDDPTYKNLASNMWVISIVIVAFGIAMSVLVIYALASLNIDEREREIAVLKVLGYHDSESALYACRELLIITVFAAIIGVPIGILIIHLIFKAINFSSLDNINWYSYLISYFIVVIAAVVSSFLLYPKIRRIDFNISLKSVE